MAKLSLTLVLILAFSASMALALKPLSDFTQGELTFFGGAPDGMDPGSPSYGTKEGKRF
jgi:hypothetical protein